MTIYAIEARLIDTSQIGSGVGSSFLPGRITVKAQGGAEFHEWPVLAGERCWIGDRVDVVIIDPEPEPEDSTGLTPPPLDKR